MLNYNGNNKKIKQAVSDANKLLSGFDLYDRINDSEFVDATIPSYSIASALQAFTVIDINVKVYKNCRKRFANELAYFSNKKPFNININGWKLSRSSSSIVGTLIHELIHSLDNATPGEFGHVRKYSSNRNKTAPYLIGKIAKELSSNV